MTATQIANDIIGALTSGVSGLISTIPNAIKDAFEALFLTTTGSGESAVTRVSTFSIVMLIFGGIALAFGLTKLVYNLVRSKIG